MSFRIDMTSPDVDKQIELLKIYPEIAAKHYLPAVKAATNLLASGIRPNIPRGATGRAAADLGSKVTGKHVGSITGRVGWYDKNDVWYPNILEYGVGQPYAINSYVPALGVYIKTHPAMSARKFMANGFSASYASINSLMANASEAVVNNLAVP